MSQNQKINNRAKEYLALIRNKTTQELLTLRTNILNHSKAERSKSSPDNRALQSYNIQLSLIGRVLSNRKPIDQQSDKFQSVEDATIGQVKPKTFIETLKEKSLDELKVILVSTEKEVVDFKASLQAMRQSEEGIKSSQDKLQALVNMVDAIKAEISTRSQQASDGAKKDLKDAERKILGIDRDYFLAGLAGGVIVGAIGNSYGKNIWGFGIIGIAIGSGLVYLNRNVKASKTATP
jgi:hypothetical protein